ncbi:MAG: hypothetical protein KKB51_03685 [Candidatus Riflebacteria bacterium]|nr:hypothetical protein [Candidatus Riflebacteria bacterium]
MVKIDGKCALPGGFDFIPGATYVGDSRALGLAVFLDQDDSSRVLLRFRNQKTRRVDYREFSRVVSFIENFSSGENTIYESPSPNPLKISIVLLENSRILLRLEDSSTVLLSLEFFQTLNILVAINKKMEAIVHRNLERKAFLQAGSLSEQFKNWGGLLTFSLLAVLDFLLLISLLIWPDLYIHWLVMTLFLAFWLLIFKPAWSPSILPAIKGYLDDGLLADLSEIRFPRRGVEIFLIILVLAAFYFFFGNDAANFITKHYRGSSLP